MLYFSVWNIVFVSVPLQIFFRYKSLSAIFSFFSFVFDGQIEYRCSHRVRSKAQLWMVSHHPGKENLRSFTEAQCRSAAKPQQWLIRRSVNPICIPTHILVLFSCDTSNIFQCVLHSCQVWASQQLPHSNKGNIAKESNCAVPMFTFTSHTYS